MSPLDELLEELRAFVGERDWEQFHDPKNLAMAIASEAGELLAEYRWVPGSEADEWTKEPENRARVEREVADVAITLFLFCDRTGIDLPDAMRRKLKVNRRNYPADSVKGRANRPEG